MMLGLGAGTVYMGREWTEEELRIKKTVRVTHRVPPRMTEMIKETCRCPRHPFCTHKRTIYGFI
jgi:hypothetical protein